MTKPTKAEYRGMAEACRRAKNHLWDGICVPRPPEQTELICNALIFTNIPAENLVRKVIARRLGRYTTLYAWLLARRCGDPRGKYAHSRAAMQQARHMWLEHLAAEFEAKAQ
jgi:hypothetical protein